MEVTWTELKQFVDDRDLSVQWVEISGRYHLIAFDKNFSLECTILKTDPVGEEQEDFEENYKSLGNKKLDNAPTDSDGSPLQRTKITTTGWHYQLHGIEFETSKLDSIISKKVDNTNYNFTSMKYYKLDSGNEVQITGEDLTQEFLDANCIKTVVDWEPNHDLEMIGGMLKQTEIPSEDLRVWVIGVPDVPENYGGSKPFAINVNLKYMGLEEGVKVDGRAPKYLTYDANYHTSKLRLMFRHSTGFKHKMHMIFELFKA